MVDPKYIDIMFVVVTFCPNLTFTFKMLQKYSKCDWLLFIGVHIIRRNTHYRDMITLEIQCQYINRSLMQR